MLVEAIENVRITSAGLTANLQEIVTTPTSFVALDPSIEGPGEVQEEGASVAVTRERRPAKTRRTRAAASAVAPPAGGGETAVTAEPPVATVVAEAAVADVAPEAPADPHTAEVPVVSAVYDNGTAAPTPV
jgi:hypothetical protein